MIRLAKQYLNWSKVILSIILLMIQISCDLYLPTVTASIVDNGIAKNNLHYIWITGFKMIFIAIVGVISAGGNIYFAATQSQQMGSNVRLALYRKIMSFTNQDLNRFSHASLITRTTNDIVQIQNVMVNILRMMMQSPIMLIGAIILAFLKGPKLTLIFVVSLVILAIVVGTIMYFVVPLFRSLQSKIDKLNLIFREGLTGVRVIRSFNRDHYEQQRFDKSNKNYTKTGIKAYVLSSLMFPIMTFILNFTNIAIVWFGSQLIIHHAFAVGNLIAFMTYSTQILMSFMMLSMIFVFLPRASASASRINEVLDTHNSVQDVKNPGKLSTFNNGLTFDHVSLTYNDQKNAALQDIDFHINNGKTLAIIGKTGSGKSSLINLIPRLYDPTKGRILLNNQPINQISQKDLHQNISFAQQNAFLFKGTIRDNIKFGNQSATDKDIWHALRIADANDFVKDEDGLDTKVEQNGANFSGGQKQRLSIARSIIKPANIYIFDDSFSALDFKTDAQLRKNLSKEPQIQSAINIIVAQRISTVINADLILVLNQGRIVGKGTHKQLSAHNRVYQSILYSQFGKDSDSHV